jgi:integrase
MNQALKQFHDAMGEQSPETLRTYSESLRLWLRYNKTTDHDKLIMEEPAIIQQKIKTFLQVMKSENISYSTRNKAYWAIRKFYAANQIMINWDWLDLFKPKREASEQDDRPYTKPEVKLFLDNTDDLRIKTSILIMATSGIRVGAIPTIRISDLEYLSDADLYCLTIYPLDKDHKYRTFVTPEASLFVDKLKGKLDGKQLLFTNKRDRELPISKTTIQMDIWKLSQKIGLREATNRLDRKAVQLAHGFRKFATSTWAKSGLDRELRELLDGQNPGVQKRYAKLTTTELFETSRYSQAIDALTFNLS